jgi:haloalkane dehalogenase
MTENVPPHLFPFQSRFACVEGHRIHYVDEGQGPTLLLFHGNPTWSFLYRKLIVKLRGRFRCVAFDYPGFGLSRARGGYDFRPASHAQVARAFIEQLGLASYIAMVQDWGGPIGLWVAGQRPAAVRGLVIGNSWAWPIDGDPHFERFSRLMGGPLGGFAIRRFNVFVNVILRAGVRRRLDRAEMAAYRLPFLAPQAREPMHVFPREIRGSSDFLAQVEAGLAALRDVPVLLAWGTRDPVFRAQERARFERLFPSHQTLLLERASHYIQEDAPDEIAVAIDAWWDQHDLHDHARA